MIFETEEDKRREAKAIDKFVSLFGGSYQKLGPTDIDYKVFDKNNKLITYVEVRGRVRSMRDAYPLPIDLSKLVKLHEKRLNPVIIWSCDDGIIYGQVNKIVGEVSCNSSGDIMAYYDKQRAFKYVRYT